MAAAATTARTRMVRYWRARNASAPWRMASEISRISGLPVSAPRTWRASRPATTNDSTLMARTNGRTIWTSIKHLLGLGENDRRDYAESPTYVKPGSSRVGDLLDQ